MEEIVKKMLDESKLILTLLPKVSTAIGYLELHQAYTDLVLCRKKLTGELKLKK